MAELIDQLDQPCTSTTLMTDAERPWNKAPLRVPRADQSLLAVPRLAEAALAIPRNAGALDHADLLVAGRPLGTLRAAARSEAIAAAIDYTQRIAGTPIAAPPAAQGLVVDGHQPSLFHPGVWIKNFALGRLARSSQRTGLHLIVDNDALSTTGLTVPAGGPDHPELETVLFDRPHVRQPWEEARIEDEERFSSFAARVRETLAPWGFRPLLDDVWQFAADYRNENDGSAILRDALTAVRHRTERRWGLTNLELPLSVLCETSTFRAFAWHIFEHLEEFLHVHNDVLNEYRRVNGLRSQTHPVPELTRDGEWLEAPFWLWQRGDARRQRVFVRRHANSLELRGDQRTVVQVPLHATGDPQAALQALADLTDRGIRLRTRALTTTLFARVFLADLFVHGIGGAKYDEMTDRIVTRFFRISAPEFLTISATVHLPLTPVADVTEADLTRIDAQLRDLHFNPERYLESPVTPALSQLLAERQALIAEQRRAEDQHAHAGRDSDAERRSGAHDSATGRSGGSERRAGYARYRRLRTLVEEIAPFTQHLREDLQRERDQTVDLLQENALRLSREYAFCLYPEDKLRAFLTGLETAE